MKILILKPSSLGDVIQALPVLRLLRLHFPQSEIYWWIDARFASLLRKDPDLTGIITFERKRWSSPLYWNEMWECVMEMRRHRFDWVIDLQGLARSGAFAWLANGQLLIGVDDSREGATGYYDVRVQRPSPQTHAVDWYLEVVRELKVPVHENFTWLPENAYARAVVEHKAKANRWIVINPGARWANKRWPTEYFAELVRLLAKELPEHRFAILGSLSDAELGRQISCAAPERCLDLTGKTMLPEMVEWIRISDALVTNDTGPMHAGSALKKPVIGLFGPTNPNRTGPYGQIEEALQFPLPCAPCMKSTCAYAKPMECLRGIFPQRVAREVVRRLNGTTQVKKSLPVERIV